MTTYPQIKGLRVKYLSADPSGAENGQVWYNSTTGNLRIKGIQGTGAWSSGGNYPVPIQSGAGFGTQTAGVVAGGTPPGPVGLKTFEYDGSSWTAGNDMARASGSPYTSAYTAGGGTLSAGWAAGGGYPTANALTENYNGTNWTASAAMPSSRRGGNVSGPQTAGLYFAGVAPGGPPAPVQASTFEYDGEGWTAGGNLNTARTNAGSTGPTGSQTAALCFGGNAPSQTSNNEEYNGTAWTEVTNYPSGLSYLGYAGTQTACIGFNGYPGGPGVTAKSYDGTNWSSIPSLSVARLNYHQNGGTANAAFVAGGEGTSGLVNATEEFTIPVETKNLSTS